MEKYGIKIEANPGRELYEDFGNVRYARFPVTTPIVNIGDSIQEFIQNYIITQAQKGDVICISAKVISICKALVVHESEVKISLLAKIIVKFVKKWPSDIGYSHPRKMQLAIDQVGYPRTILALIIGTIMKLIGKPGYFYRVAGNNINAIDGFNPVSKPPMNEYAVMPPKNGNRLCDEFEIEYGFPFVILDGNNIDNNILGMSKTARELYSIMDFMLIVKGNPQGQEDDGQVTPVLLVRKARF